MFNKEKLMYWRSMGSIRSSYALNFLNPSLDSSLTFSRATSATMYNSSGYLVYAPMNLLTYSNNFSNGAWSKGTGTTVNGQTATDPFGVANNAWSVTIGNTSNGLHQALGIITFFTLSVWLQTTNGQNATVYLHAGNASNGQYITVTPQWQRFSVTCSSSGEYFEIRTDYPIQQPTVTLNMYGAQAELTSIDSPHAYTATTSSVYYGPRFDYNPSTLAINGLLIEGQSTNLVTQSQSFSSWMSNLTVTPNAATSPDGTGDATLLTATGNIYQSVYLTVTTSNSTPYTLSVYAKAGNNNTLTLELRGATGSVYDYLFTLSGAGTATINGSAVGSPSGGISYVGNGWYRLWVTKTTTNTAPIAIIGYGQNATVGWTNYIYGAQLEALTFPSSYIPTTSASATRAQDVLANTSIGGWFSQAHGTIVVEAITEGVSGFSADVSFNDGTSSNEIYAVANNQGYSGIAPAFSYEYGGTLVSLQGGATQAVGSVVKIAGTYNGSTINAYANGTSLGSAASIGAISGITTLNLGSRYNGTSSAYAWLRNLSYYNTALSNAQINTISGAL